MPLPVPAELDASLRIDEVTTIAPDAEWSRLLTATQGAAVFQSWEWIAAWTEHFLPPHARPTRIACTAAGALRAQAWLYRYDGDGHDRWLLVGSGISDNLDPLVDAHATPAAAALFEGLHLLARAAPVDLLQLSAGSHLVEHARRAGCAVLPAEPCLVIDVQDGAGLETMVNAGLARAIAYARRRLSREGVWSIEHATPDTLHALLDRLFELHGARWHARGESGVLADANVCSFHQSVATRLFGRGLVLRALRLNGRIIACHYGFRTADRELYYIGGFDPAAARLSPGMVLLAHAFERTRADGLRWLDLLRGREPYKYAWGAREHPHVRIVIR